MDPHPAAIDAAHRNFVGSYRLLVRHVHGAEQREFGSVFAFTTGVPVGIFNGCIVAARPIDADLEAALDWPAGRAWGCQVVTLQSSRMGFGVYEAMGFHTVASFGIYRRAS